MSRLVRRIGSVRSGETGLYLEERYRDNIDPNTGEQIKEKQLLVYWPEQGTTRWSNAAYLEVLTDSGENEK